MTYFDNNDSMPPGARIKVIGVGGGGGNAVNTMIRSTLEGVEFIAANTDLQSLRFSLAPTKIQLGRELTKGLGAGADPDIGRDAALEDRHQLQEALSGSDMVFITAGMGGGTGTGGASVVAQIARELGALTVAVVTKPFQFEGKRRLRHSEIGIDRLREHVDTLITIPNQRLLQIATPNLTMIEAFNLADNVLVNAVKGISDIINVPGTVNVDFADVKTVMSSMGHAMMGIGTATGEDRAVTAARQAISSPLLEDIDIEGATGILINITASNNISLLEVNEACSVIQEAAHEDANIIFGSVIDESMGDSIRVTVIATGFPVDGEQSDIYQNRTEYKNRIVVPEKQIVLNKNPYPSFLTSSSRQGASTFTGSFDPKRASFAATSQEKLAQEKQQAADRLVQEKSITDHISNHLGSEVNLPPIKTNEQSYIGKSKFFEQEMMKSPTADYEAQKSTVMNMASSAPTSPKSLFASEAELDSEMEDGENFSADHDEFVADPQFSAQSSNEVTSSRIDAGIEEITGASANFFQSEIDKSIDDALKISERLNNDYDHSRLNDDLDIPTFIRQGVKGISPN